MFTFIGCLIFALIFCGIWCLKEAMTPPSPPFPSRTLLVGLVFILIALVLWLVPIFVKV